MFPYPPPPTPYPEFVVPPVFPPVIRGAPGCRGKNSKTENVGISALISPSQSISVSSTPVGLTIGTVSFSTGGRDAPTVSGTTLTLNKKGVYIVTLNLQVAGAAISTGATEVVSISPTTSGITGSVPTPAISILAGGSLPISEAFTVEVTSTPATISFGAVNTGTAAITISSGTVSAQLLADNNKKHRRGNNNCCC